VLFELNQQVPRPAGTSGLRRRRTNRGGQERSRAQPNGLLGRERRRSAEDEDEDGCRSSDKTTVNARHAAAGVQPVFLMGRIEKP
jgi:hypothetical protein